MARLPRLAVAGYLHHVLLKGHDGMPVFRDDDDRQAFLDTLTAVAATEGVAIHGYALLDSEVQLLLTPARADGIGRMMQSLGRSYGARFNRRHGRTGSLWSGRYRSSIVEPKQWALRCLRHVELAGAVTAAGGAAHAHAWSSASHHLGKAHAALVREHAEYWSLGNTPFEREAQWAQFLQTAPKPDESHAIRRAAECGWALGNDAFVRDASLFAGRRLAPARPGRPKKAVPE